MANLPWNFLTEGSLRLKDSIHQIIYHKSLNVVVVITQDGTSIVIDVNSGSALHRTSLVPPDQGKPSPEWVGKLTCLALPEHSALLISSNQAVGLRQDLGQVLLLESILQVPVSFQDAVIRIEMPGAEAMQLLQCLQSLDLSGEPDLVAHREQVADLLTQQMRQSFSQSKAKFKTASWAIIYLELPLYSLRTVCLHAVQDMRRHNRHVPALPIASALAIRTAVLLKDNHPTSLSSVIQPNGAIGSNKELKTKAPTPAWKIAWEKVGEGEGSIPSPLSATLTNGPSHSWMVSEAARRETFYRWPHMKYKWALPEQMAEAGFYHQPNTPESDRAVCFQCNVCLICWEPNDEPWSEHERHAPLCQFVKGEYTQNVPIETTLATYPALTHSERGESIACLSTTSCSDYVATATQTGSVVLWNTSCVLKRDVTFSIDSHAISTFKAPSSTIHTSLSVEALSVLGSQKSGVPASRLRDEEASKPRPCLVVGVSVKSVHLERDDQDSTLQPDEKGQVEVLNDVNSRHKGLDIMEVDRDDSELSCATHLTSNWSADLYLLVYDVCQRKTSPPNPPTNKDEQEGGPTGSQPSSSTGSVKKSSLGGTTKKPGTGTTSSGTQQECSLYNQNRDMFYSVYDDPLVDDMMSFAEESAAGSSLQSKLKKVASFSYELGQAGSAFTNPVSMKVNPPLIDGFPYSLSKKETHDGTTTPNVTPTLVQKIDLKPFLQNNQDKHAFVLSLTPSCDGKFLLVAVGPKPEPIVVKQKHEASFPTLLSDINDTTPSLMSDESQEAQLRALWSPTQDENVSVVRNLSSPGASQATGSLILLAVNSEGEMMTVQEEPLMVQHISKDESPRDVVMLPTTSDDAALVLVGQDGKLRLYDLLDLELKAEMSHEDGFVSATYCTNMERLCAATKEGVLCFYRIHLNTGTSQDEDFVDGGVGFSKMELDLAEENSKGKGKGKSPMKLLINQPLTQENLLQLHALTECENIPQGFSAVVPSCWLELPQAQKLRRQPQPLQAVGEEAHHTRTWRLQPDGSTWDEHLLEISLAQTWTLGHIDIRFTLVAGCTHVPQVQISLLEHRSSNAPLGMSKAWGDEEIAVEVDQGLEFTPLGGSVINPVLTTEFLETHDATLLCGPIALDTCLDSTGQSGTVTLASPLLLAAHSRHYLIHLKYIPQGDSAMEQDSVLMQWPFRNSGSKSVLDRLSLNSTKRPVKGCDMLQEISVSVRKAKPTAIPRDKLQRCMMLNNASFVGKLRDEIIREPVVRLNQNLALDIAIWVATVCTGMPDTAEKNGKAGSVILEELSKNLLPLVHRVWIRGYRTSAEKMAKLVLACLQLEKDCGGSKVFQKGLLEAQQEALPQLVSCDSPSAMYWFTAILSRLVSLDPQAVSDAAWALLNRVSQVYQSQTHPLHLLLQTRFGLYGKPFESVLFTLPSPGGLNMGGFSGPASINWGPSVNSKSTGNTNAGGSGAAMAGRLALDSKFALSAAALALGGEGKDVKDILKRGYGNHQLLIKDLTEVEPLVVTLCQASDGTRLEKLDAGPGLFSTTSSAGFVQTSSSSAAGAPGSAGDKAKPFLWQHLLLAPHVYAWHLERLHSGARRFLTLDLGQPVLLTDICIPSCPEFVCLAVDVWLKKEETDGCRLALATDIASKPIMLLDLQPPPLCRYMKLTIVGRYGMSTTSVKTPLGYFYGHTVLVPNDFGVNDQVPLKTEQIQAELEVVEGLADQVTCHYHLATSKLQTLLWPLLDSRRCNPVISHVQHYLKSQLESQRSFSNAFKGQVSESDKVCSVYEECLRLQLQWNTLKGVAKRLRRALVELGVLESEPQETDNEEALKEAGSDKLQFLAHSLVNLLLSINSLQENTSQQSMTETACQTFFERLLVTAPPPLQLGGASLLAHHCGTEHWWGNFIANMIRNHLASRQEYPWPQDRVFLALTFMAHKTMAISASKVLDALSQSLCQSLDVLDSCQSTILPAMLCRVDLPFIHWHLLFMTYLLDRLSCVPTDTEDEEGKENGAGSASKSNNSHNLPGTSTGSGLRWEFLQGESSLHKVNPLASSRSSAGRLFRRKLQKRLFHHKQQWEELELKKIFKDPAPELTSLAGSAKKVVGGYRTPSNPLSKAANSNNNLNSGGGAGPIRRGDGSATSSTSTEERPREERRIIGWRHAVLLVRRLVQLLLLIGDNHQSDTFLLIAKVLGKIANIVRPVLHLGDVMTTDQLVELLQKAVKPSIIAGDAIAHQWMNHAITCLLQDFLAQSKKSSPATRFYNASSSNTFTSVNPANVEENKDSMASGVKTEDAVVMSEYMEGVEEESVDALQNLPPKEASSSSAKAAGGAQSGLTQDATDIDLLVSGLMEGANDFALSDEMYGHLLKAPKNSKPIHIPPPTSTAATLGAQNGPFTLNELEPLPLSPEHLPFLSPASPTTPVMAHNYPGANQMSKHKANGVETFISKLLDNYPPDNYPKPPVCSRVVRVFPSKEEKLKEEASLSNISSASDSRMETRVEGGLGQKLELFCLLHEESVHQVMVNPIAAEVPAARIEVTVVEDSLPSLCTGTNISMLSTAFNQIFTQQINTMGVEAVSALRLWMQVNLEVSESPTQGVYEAATVPAIVLSLEAIRNLLAVLSRQPQMDVGAWCTLFQALSWLCNLRCTSPPRAAGTDAPPPTLASTGVYDSVLEELAGIFLAGGILRDPALVPLLYNFLSGNALPPNMAGDRCWVGPSVTSALSDLLMRLRLWCSISAVGSRLGTELRRALLGLALQLCQPGGSFASGRGPLDAQSLLLDSMLKLVYDGADTPTCIALVEAVACLVHSKMEGCEQVTSSNSVSHVVNPFLCFGGLVLAHANKEMAGSHALATSDQIFSSLLQLAAKLASAPLAPPLPTPATASSSTASPSVVFGEESLTDSSKIEQAESLESDSQTDERKVEQQNERASHIRPENKPPCFADVMLQSPSIVLALLSSLTKCQASLLALTLGPATLAGGKFPFGDPSSLGDHVIHLLLTLLDKTTNPSLIVAPLCRFLAATQNTTGLSDPLLWFVLHVLNTSKLVQDFHSASGVFLVANHVVRSHVALSNNQLGLVSNIIRYMSLAASHASMAGISGGGSMVGSGGSSNAAGTKMGASLGTGILVGSAPTTVSASGTVAVSARKTPAAALESVEGLLNFAPLGSIASSNPSAQPADALLLSVPPHRRARTPAWSHHFYPSEHWVELTVTLPCAVLLHEIQLQPHLTSLATCPAAVALEVSAEGPASLSPVSGPVNTTGLAFIALKLPRPKIANVVLIRLYKPRDSSNVGLAQLRLLGSLAIPTGSGNGPLANAATLSKTPGVHASWIHLLHHCVETVSGDSQNALLSALSGLPRLVEGCCAHFVTLSSTGSISCSQKGDLKAKLHSIILRLGRLDCAVGLQCLQWFLDAESGGEAVAHLIYELCLTRDEHVSQRLHCLLEWLQSVVQGQQTATPTQTGILIHCAAAVLWAWQETTDVAVLVAPFALGRLAQCIYSWVLRVSVLLPVDGTSRGNEGLENGDSSLKKALDSALCALAYVDAGIMDQVLKWTRMTSFKDDFAGSSLTDDSKGTASTSAPSTSATSAPTSFLFGLSPGQLTTIARTAQSPLASRKFFDCVLVKKLAQMVTDYCRNAQEAPDQNVNPVASTSRSLTDSDKEQWRHQFPRQQAQAVTQVLRFFTRLCAEGGFRNALIEKLEPDFMSILISTFCSPGGVANAHARSNDLEAAVVRFLQVFCWAHRENQRRLAHALYAVLEAGQNSGSSQHIQPVLTGFTRRLLFQLLLETEKLYLFVQSPEVLPGSILAAEILEPRHPKYGVGPQRRLIQVGANCTVDQVLDWLTNGSPTRGTGALFKSPSEAMAAAATAAAAATSGTSTGAKAGTSDPVNQKLINGYLSFSDQLSFVLGTLNQEKRSKSGTSRSGLGSNTTKLEAGLNPFSKASIAQSLRSGLQFVVSNPTLHLSEWSGAIPGHVTFSQLYTWLERKGKNLDPPCIHLNISFSHERSERMDILERTDPFPTILQDFAAIGGLALLAHYLPLVTSDVPLVRSPVSAAGSSGAGSSGPGVISGNEPLDVWVKIEENEDLDDDIEEIIMSGSMGPGGSNSALKKLKASLPLTLPQHSLAAFSLFLRIPLYADALLRDRQRAQMLLRLALGVCDDGEGGDILASPESASLPTLPFALLKQLLITQPPSTDDGLMLRKKALEVGAVQLLLACLAVFTQQLPSAAVLIPGLGRQLVITAPSTSPAGANAQGGVGNPNFAVSVPNKASYYKEFMPSDEDDTMPLPVVDGLTQTSTPNIANNVAGTANVSQAPQYWAKGTGFGTGSTAQSWDVEEALLRQRAQEEQATCLVLTLAAYVRPEVGEPMEEDELGSRQERDGLPEGLLNVLKESCLVQAICSYLRNDSVMDMARHVPLYKALLQLVRALALSSSLSTLLCSPHNKKDLEEMSIFNLLGKMKDYVSTYAARIAATHSQTEDTDADGGLADLIADITSTWPVVQKAIQQIMGSDAMDTTSDSGSLLDLRHCPKLPSLTPEQCYMEVMRKLQFESFEMLVESEGGGYKFTVPFHFEGAVRLAGERSHPTRMKRLAQEAATLLTSLPLSASSSVFVRCDTDRLDVMKVLITGPADTPYANGCYEFDVYFPVDYPQSPMQIHLCTTGRQTIRFNPNLYNDGKVCLSVLNTWHGRPEEKWNSSTSSFLQVLVSIQSLILVSEPYFNEPGYERSRGTPSGTQNSRDYDANIRQASVRWAMLEQLRNPSACFKDVLQAHFWLKREEIEQQIEGWLEEMESQVAQDPTAARAVSVSLLALERHYTQLKEELSRLSPPGGVESNGEGENNSQCNPEKDENAEETREREPSGNLKEEEASGQEGEAIAMETSPSSQVPGAEEDKSHQEASNGQIWTQDFGEIPSPSWKLDSDEDSDEFDSFISQFIV